MNHILVVDDEPDMLEMVKTALERDGHQVDINTVSTQIEPEKCRMYDLILLDVMMPKEDGFAFLRRIRAEVDCPILFLTARTDDASLVKGLGLGADEYIKKPFTIAELRARVNAHLRRANRQPVHVLHRGNVTFQLEGKQASVGEHILSFTKGEYEICEFLALHAGQVFTKERLYEEVFGYDAEGDASAVTEHIKNIRAKLKKEDVCPIETVWGVGYKWVKENIQ